MQPTSVLLTLLLTFTTAVHSIAVAAPQEAKSSRRTSALTSRQANSTNSTVTPQAQQLANSIGLNIIAQQGVIAVVQSIQQQQQSGLTDTLFFNASINNLHAFATASATIRVQNQALSRVNPQVARGLGQIEAGQVLQLGMINRLTGNPASDAPVLAQLLGAVRADVGKNTALESLALGGSDVPGEGLVS